VSEPLRQTPRTLDEYLDGLVEGDDRVAAERRIAGDTKAAREVELQGEIDRSLRRLFGEGGGVVEVPALGGTIAKVGPRTRWRWVAAAAAVALVTLAGLYGVLLLTADRTDRLGPIYTNEVAGGFVPREVCTDAAQFAAWTKEHYGQALYPSADAERAGVTLVGWSYGVGVTNYSGVLLARVEGTPVVVLVDKAKAEGLRELPKPEGGSLRSFRRRIGDLVLYEVTPLAEPRVLPLVSERPAGGAGQG
jgi:hypothetical protein